MLSGLARHGVAMRDGAWNRAPWQGSARQALGHGGASTEARRGPSWLGKLRRCRAMPGMVRCGEAGTGARCGRVASGRAGSREVWRRLAMRGKARQAPRQGLVWPGLAMRAMAWRGQVR